MGVKIHNYHERDNEMDTLYFFASDEDIYKIFETIEGEFDIKYCVERTKSNLDYKPTLEFDSIRDLELKETKYLITKKEQIMNTVYRRAYSFYENYYPDNKDSVQFAGRGLYRHNELSDYRLHIDLDYKSDYAQMLFKRIVKEVKHNCIKIDYYLCPYIGKELYKNKNDYVFFAQRALCPVIITDSGEPERWWWNEEVRLFMKRPLDEQLDFFSKILSNGVISDYNEEFKNETVNYQIYEGVFSKLYVMEHLDSLKNILPLFNDNSNAKSPNRSVGNIMEDLHEMVIDLAFSYKADGITFLIKNLYLIPETGYNCGSLAIVKTLLKKKYIEFFKQSLLEISQEDKERIKSILTDITEKRLVKTRDTLLNILNS